MRRGSADPGLTAVARLAEWSKGDNHRRQADDDVADCLEAALWAFHRSESFQEGALLAVNLGDDADTTGAVYDQLAGAFYGASAIPSAWLAKLLYSDRIIGLADRLIARKGGHE